MKYNTVAHPLIPFTALQSIRALCFITLSICFGLFFFIKVTQGLHFYSFHSLGLSTAAFFFLFVEFGKERCYQEREKKVRDDPKLENKKETKNYWTWGVFFYSLAFPMTFVNYFLYVVGLGNQTSIRQDIFINIAT